MFRPTNVYESLFPIYFISKVVGLCCFEIRSRGYSRSYLGYIYPSIVTTVYIYFSCTKLPSILEGYQNSLFRFLIVDVTVVVIVLNTLVILLAHIFACEKVIKWTNDIKEFDDKMGNSMENHSFRQSHQKTQFFTVKCFSVVGILLVIHIIGGNYSQYKQILNLYSFDILTVLYPIISTSVMIWQFTGMLFILKERFSWINKELYSLRQKWHKIYLELGKHGVACLLRQVDYKSNENNLITSLEELRLNYHYLESLTRNLNSIFALPILASLLKIFIFPLGYLLLSLTVCWKSNKCHSGYFTVYFSIFGTIPLISIFHVTVLSFIGAYTSREAKKTALILHSIEHTSDEVMDYIKYFSGQILHMDIDVTIYGMFSLNKSLVFSMVSGIISYFILFIQSE